MSFNKVTYKETLNYESECGYCNAPCLIRTCVVVTLYNDDGRATSEKQYDLCSDCLQKYCPQIILQQKYQGT